MAGPTLELGTCVTGLTPFNRSGEVDEGALRAHVQWLTREGISFWPAGSATGEGPLLSDAEMFRVWDIVVEEVAGRIPVIAPNRGFPTSAQNIRFAREAHARGMDAIHVYPPMLGQSIVPTAEMLARYYDEVLSGVELPTLLSSSVSAGFEPARAVLEKVVADYSHVVVGVFKNHSDQANVAEFSATFSPRIRVLTLSRPFLYAVASGATGILDIVQNVAPRLSRRYYDAVLSSDVTSAQEAYRQIAQLSDAIAQVSTRYSVPTVVTYKVILNLLGVGGGNARAPYLAIPDETRTALRQTIDELGLREIEGLA